MDSDVEQYCLQGYIPSMGQLEIVTDVISRRPSSLSIHSCPTSVRIPWAIMEGAVRRHVVNDDKVKRGYAYVVTP